MSRLLSLLLVLHAIGSVPAMFRQYRLIRQANTLYVSGDYRGAESLYRQLLQRYPVGIVHLEAQFNLAGTEYRLRRYRESAALFGAVREASGTPGRIGIPARYNEGNALAMTALGPPLQDSAAEPLRQSLACYRAVLLSDPDNIDARINYEIVERALQQLRRPPAPSGSPPDSGKGNPSRSGGSSGTGMNPEVTGLILENARREELELLRKYYRPAGTRREGKENRDW
jgi:tetratricopeptide (TPR) repeat protein